GPPQPLHAIQPHYSVRASSDRYALFSGPRRETKLVLPLGAPEHDTVDHQDRERHEHEREDDIAQEMRTLGYADEARNETGHGTARGEGQRPLWDEQGERVKWHNDRCRFPAYEGTGLPTLPGGNERCRECLCAAEFDHVFGPCAPNLRLEQDVGDETRTDAKASRNE